jgi:hypothetical protein
MGLPLPRRDPDTVLDLLVQIDNAVRGKVPQLLRLTPLQVQVLQRLLDLPELRGEAAAGEARPLTLNRMGALSPMSAHTTALASSAWLNLCSRLPAVIRFPDEPLALQLRQNVSVAGAGEAPAPGVSTRVGTAARTLGAAETSVSEAEQIDSEAELNAGEAP